jgi:hypothetical protein
MVCLSFTGCATDIAVVVADSLLGQIGTSVQEALGKAIAAAGTMWVYLPTPDVSGNATDTGTGIYSGGSPGVAAQGVKTVLDYATWIGVVSALGSLIVLGAMIGVRLKHGEGFLAVGRAGIILGAVILIGGASPIVKALSASDPASGASETVFFLQWSTWWIVGALAVLSVIVAGIKMVWEQRAEPGKQLMKSLATLIVVAGASVGVITLLTGATDAFSSRIITSSLNCPIGLGVYADGTTCFGQTMLGILTLGDGLGVLLIIILGMIAITGSIFQVVLMAARIGMVFVLTGVLPISASFTNTQMGSQWFKKNVGWLLAFILYKPAAAIVYAAAFTLSGSSLFNNGDPTGLTKILVGLMLMIMALLALPALMRFVTPLVGPMTGGGGAMMLGMAAMAALPTGAVSLGRVFSGGDSNGSSSDSNSPGSPGPTGNASPSGGSGAVGPTGGWSSTGSAGAGAASAGSASAGTGAAGAGAAAAGPAAPAVIGTQALVGVAQGAAQVAKGVASEATQEGPSGVN